MGRATTLAALLLFGTCICAGPSDARTAEAPAHVSIIKGKPASIADLPWLAKIDYEGAVDAMGCTGTVIAPRVILTAAHCVLSGAGRVERAGGFTVITGAADLRKATRANVSRVSRVLVFPGHSPATHLFDAALLVLSAPVAAPSLPLATASDVGLLEKGTPVMVAGWGLTSSDPEIRPAVLRQAETVIQGPLYCDQKTKRFFHFYPAYQFCAVLPPRLEVTTCHGDSGGPGIARREDGTLVQVGIIDLGAPDCDPRVPEAFVRVDVISSWATSWIAASEFGAPAPRPWVPKIRIPRLPIQFAEEIAIYGLSKDFQHRLPPGTPVQLGCLRLERAKVKCRISWHQDGNHYYGSATAFFAARPEGELWHYRYKIHWVDDHCRPFGRHRKACPIRTRAL